MIENRLISVTVNSQVTLFTYDADGNRVKSVMGTETTLFIGGHYEVTNPGSGQTVTKYYFAGTQRVAMRKYTIPTSMAVEYFLGDHLGSTSVTTNSAGTKVSEVRYKPWGEIRSTWTSGIVTTPAYKLAKYLYTGQFSYMDDPTTAGVTEGFGLMFYNARWYDPYLNHFTQPDSIIPDPYNPQDWNRYSYARNNPVRYNDPSGHLPCWTCGLTSGFLAFFGLAPDYRGIAMAEALVTNGDTIIAAGMAVQSQWYIKVWDDPSNPAASSYGPAQIVQAEIEKYGLSNQDLHDPTISVKVMTSRIDSVVSACPNCIDRDKFILSALAQNGSEYALNALEDVSLRDPLPDGGLDWEPYFDSLNPKGNLYDLRANGHHNYDSRFMLHLFMNDLEELKNKGWDLPELTPDDWKYINRLRWNNRVDSE